MNHKQNAKVSNGKVQSPNTKKSTKCQNHADLYF